MLALVVAGYLALPILRGDRAAPPPPAATPTPQVRMIAGFPEYEYGYKVVPANEIDLSERVVSLQWTPDGGVFSIDAECRDIHNSGAGPAVIQAELWLNGRHVREFDGCPHMIGDASTLDSWDAAAGTPVTLEVKVVGAKLDGETVEIPRGRLGLAVRTTVPFLQFPLPPAPEHLKSLGELRMCTEDRNAPLTGIVHSDPGNPLQPRTMTVTWGERVIVTGRGQTPGSLRIEVNGHDLITFTAWDYEVVSFIDELTSMNLPDGLSPKAGDKVTLTPEHVTGDWAARALTLSPGPLCFLEADGTPFSYNV